MSFKLKTLVGALALCAAGTANATINSMSSGDGELFMSIRDNSAVAPSSYVLDLNVNMSAFDGNATQSWAADSTLQSFLASGSGNYSWAVMAGDSNTTVGGTATSNAAGAYNYLTTAAAGSAAQIGTETNFGLYQWNAVDTYLTNVNAQLAASNSATFTGADAGFFSSAYDSWFNNSPMNAAGAMGDSLAFYHASNSGNTAGLFTKNSKIDVATYAGTWTLAANGDLSYSAVPVPAAVWLLGSALVGMVGVARRREVV